MAFLNSLRQVDNNGREQVISYLKMRFGIGLIGVSFPFMLVLANVIGGGGIVLEDSISDYYDNNVAGDIFIGILFALGFFLSSYRGENKREGVLATFAAVLAFMTALFPTTSMITWVRMVHWIAASSMFLIFVYFAFLFYRQENSILRKKTYLFCAILMLVGMLFIGIMKILGNFHIFEFDKATYIGEAVALFAFGVSWINKTEVQLADLIPFRKTSSVPV